MTSAVVPWRAPAAHGDRPAIVDGSVVWTHGRLGARVDAWAAAIAATAHHGEHVAVQLPHGAEVVAAWLGILTAGRAALVLDPEQPVPQRTGALVFAEAGLLLASADDARLLRDAGFHGIVLDPEDVAQRAATTCPALGDPATRACLFFTSGSTGVPRAVVWRRRTLACAARHLDAMFAFAPTDRHALLAPLAVAATAAQVTATLAAGASLHLREARRHATSDVARWLRDAGITTLQTVPSLHRALSAAPRQWPTLRALKLGGETVTAADAQRFAATAPAGAILINGLGLTEAGFNVCWHVWRAGDPLDGPFVPIGRPPPGVELRLDGDEILVASPALADGYWRDPARTAERYRALPDRPGWRELRTGDAGRWRADGALEHLGRRDAMVKVRGHRVDPAEVEAALLATTGVAEAVVVPADGDEVRLCAFVRLHAGTALTPAALHRSLAARLPAHMLPSSLRIVDALPMLDGGKIDRRALLQLAATAAPAVDDAAPRDALERTLLACFRRVLPRQPFGIGASFFELGGDSLAAAELFAALAALLRIELPLADLTRNPSVEQLAEHIRRAGAQPTDDPVALLSPSPDPRATNLFMWPGAGSDVMALADLGRHLGPEVALHAIQHRGADGRRVYDVSLERMAERGVALVRRVQSRGPYALCGTSFGGLVALEVGRRLRQAGDDVPVLALLDTYAPGYPPVRRDLGVTDRLRLLRRALRPLGHKDEPGWANLRRGLREQLLRLRARIGVGRPRPHAPPLPATTRFIHLQEACFRATRTLRLAAYDGPVQLFRVDAPPPAALFALDATLGWGEWITGRLDVDVIPGRHSWHLREPNVQTLAAKLRALLASVPRGDQWDAPALWDGLADWWDGHVGDGGSDAFRDVALAALERLIDVRAGERVLDVACGNGWLSRRLAAGGARVTAVDASEGMLRHARARGGVVEFRRLDVTKPAELRQLADSTYDLAVCNLALHDLADVHPLFDALGRIVRRDGRIVLSLVHPARAFDDGVPAGVPVPRLAVPQQPMPHVEVTRPLSDLWRIAADAGLRLETLLELPAGDDPAFAIARLRFDVLRP